MAASGEIRYTLIEFSELTHLEPDYIRELVAVGIIEPGIEQDYWYFSRSHIDRCMRAERLREDLELNLHGVALALELMDRNRRLLRRIAYLDRMMARLGGPF